MSDEFDFETVKNLREQIAIQERLLALRRENGINYYVPHAKQHIFHKHAHITGRHCRTGNRGGKTRCGCAEDVAFCLGYRPWYQNRLEIRNGKNEIVEVHPGGENHPLVTHGIPQRPIKLLLIIVNWNKADELFTHYDPNNWDAQGLLFKLIPKQSLVAVHKGKSGHIERILIRRPEKYGGGVSSITITTVEAFKKNRMNAESSDWDAIHIDEPVPREMFVGHKRGLVDRGGKFWINCTPLDQMWINDEFIPSVRGASNRDFATGSVFSSVVKGFEITRFVITWDIYDNPHNTPASIAEFESTLNKEEKECRLYGKPMSSTGLVYPQFVYDEHVYTEVPNGWESLNRPPKNYTIRWWWDYHVRLPQAILFFATAPDGRVFVFDEIFDANRLDEAAEMVVKRMDGYNVVQTEIDPLAFIPNPVDETTIADHLAPYDIWVDPASKDKRLGLLKTQERLQERGADGKPTIMFAGNLIQTLYEINRYCYKEGKQEAVDKDDHMMENLRRGILSELRFIEPAEQIRETFRKKESERFDFDYKPKTTSIDLY